MASSDFTFTIKRTALDEDYRPAENTRITTNFANLARGERRQENLRNTLRMIDNRFNSLADRNNPRGDRYAVELQIVSVEMSVCPGEDADAFPLIEILQTTIIDRADGARIDGIVGNNFSSYVRDYDFSVVLPEHMKVHARAPDDFGDLHGKLFRRFLTSSAYRDNFAKPPVICLSVSSNKTYHRTGDEHRVLGLEYANDDVSPTDRYFAKMGMKVRYFMPRGSVAPFAFYHIDDLTADYTDLELVSTIATMETFQKIYRPEIYNANSPATAQFQPSLKAQDYSLTRIVYDREERSRLAVEQGRFVEERFIKPYRQVLDRWSASFAA
ncbi:DUF1852 domain-containing protein [Brevundimonas sp. SORGH_AS_0993]|uniref:DUF1852 domain-containing protein n=1 Tax=Brevundimonas sp. SORGH_AS_0993 TaxID=3041794 RepID=UPI002785C97B|nr:DUF1852 domain-containing protein [Brevundimonas sp. SORGH_AS_0993]MDQ1154184.1 hypothetical protein [Brevundimonas sp. SORGH_AS_0993]